MEENEFINECKKLNLQINENILKKLYKYSDLLQTWNRKFNLTAITNTKDIFLKHFYDSITIVKTELITTEKPISLADIGTGAGFPGIVIAIFFNNINVTLIESNEKKCKFLNEVKEQLQLENITIVNERAEILSKKEREKYDILTSRAVANLKVLCEIAIPLLKVNGYFLPLKSNINEELENTEKLFQKLFIKLEKIISFKLPIEQSLRNILIIKKTKETEKKYPREYKNIIKNPL